MAIVPSAQAHCAKPNGYLPIAAHDGTNWARGYVYRSNEVAWFSVGQQVYTSPYNAVWTYAYATSWVNRSGAWVKNTSWHWLSVESVKC